MFRAQVLRFAWKNCGKPDAPAVLKTLTLSPDPIAIPGNLTASASGSTSVELSAPLSVGTARHQRPVWPLVYFNQKLLKKKRFRNTFFLKVFFLLNTEVAVFSKIFLNYELVDLMTSLTPFTDSLFSFSAGELYTVLTC